MKWTKIWDHKGYNTYVRTPYFENFIIFENLQDIADFAIFKITNIFISETVIDRAKWKRIWIL